MKRWFKSIGVIGLALALCLLSYLKGHFDGARQARVDSLYIETAIFDGFAKGADYAKSRCGMFISANYDTLSSPSAAVRTWWPWLLAKKKDRWERLEPRAASIAAEYRGKMPTITEAKAALEKAFPDAKVEFKVE